MLPFAVSKSVNEWRVLARHVYSQITWCYSRAEVWKYIVSEKKYTTKFLSYNFSTYHFDWCSKSFHWRTLQKICNKVFIQSPTTPETRCYTTLWNANVRKLAKQLANAMYHTIYLHKSATKKRFKQSKSSLFISQLAPSHLVFKMSTFLRHTSLYIRWSHHLRTVLVLRPSTTMLVLSCPRFTQPRHEFVQSGPFPSFSRKLWHKSPDTNS